MTGEGSNLLKNLLKIEIKKFVCVSITVRGLLDIPREILNRQ